jgi:hypothetical protein
MPEIVVDDRPSLIVANLISALKAATINGVPVFSDAVSVNDVESFVRVADVLRTNKKPVCGIVEGTIERRNGDNCDQKANCRLPFDIVVRFMDRRKPGEGETSAMDTAKFLLQAAAAAIMANPGRSGLADLVQWGGEVINGTSVTGTARPVTKFANEAFFAATQSGSCVWIEYR